MPCGVQVSFRLTLSLVGLLFVVLTGFFSFFITWHVSNRVIDEVSEKLRDEVVGTVSSEVLKVTSGAREQSSRGAAGPLGSSNFGCCSVSSADAKQVFGFEQVRRYHWENLQANRRLLSSLSGTQAGALLMLAVTGNEQDIDGTGGRGGRGNFQWTVSDASTNYTLEQYFSNSYTDGDFVMAQTSRCDASFVAGSAPDVYRPLASKGECQEAAWNLIRAYTPVEERTDREKPLGCQRDVSTGQVTWSPHGASEEAASSRALCRSGAWFRRSRSFKPACSDAHPCTQGEFEPIADPDFRADLFTSGDERYNATETSWWRGAAANGESCSSQGCQGRREAGWSPVYFSQPAGQLVLPCVFPLYAGTTNMVRAVIQLGIGLKYLDEFLSGVVSKVSRDAKGWIVDLSGDPDAAGTLLASSPGGLAANLDGRLLRATEASKAGPAGQYVEAASQAIRTGAGGGWRALPPTTRISYEDDLVQAHRISDGHGLEWLFVLSVPRSVFDAKLSLARSLTLVGVCCLTAGMCLVLFLLSCAVSKHLTQLSMKMANVASMRLDSGSYSSQQLEVTTVYKEVGEIKRSFKAMAARLKDSFARERERGRQRQEAQRRRLRTRVESAMNEADNLRHPMVLCKASEFVALGRLTSYESLRDAGKLVVLDTMEKVKSFERQNNRIVMFSHQWLGWDDPDPNDVHHATMVTALRHLQRRLGRPMSAREARAGTPRWQLQLEDVYVWVDYGSIAQEHRGMQMLAISSLPVYCSVAHAFVVVAPFTVHDETCEPCDLGSYDDRGWCRVETLAKVCSSGIDNMYIMDGVRSDLTPVTLDKFRESLSLRVFEGKFSCCAMGHKSQAYCDKEQLVQSVLGLYFKALSSEESGIRRVVLERIGESKERFFPSFFKFSLPDGREEERELFGDLVSTLEVHASGDQTLNGQLEAIVEEAELPAIAFRLRNASKSACRLSKESLTSDDSDAMGPPMLAHRTLLVGREHSRREEKARALDSLRSLE